MDDIARRHADERLVVAGEQVGGHRPVIIAPGDSGCESAWSARDVR
jgi:hypothetical protein